MVNEVIVSDDWTRNWQASIAVKITALVMWVIIVAVFIVATWLLRDMESRLQADFEAEADRVAYQVATLVKAGSDSGYAELAGRLAELQQGSSFSAIGLHIGRRDYFVGNAGQGGVIERHLPTALAPGQDIDLEVFHPDLDALVAQRRNQLVIGIFATLLVFGLFLTWSIRTIVHRPLQQLVSATRAVSDGRLEVRLDISREDEFGYLSRFFNQMLDRLMAQQRELEQAAEEARSVSRAKSAFLANMSHELRTPLNAIIGYSEMLEEEAGELGVKELTPDLYKIKSAGRHLLSLINDVLDLSKIEAGKMEINPVMFQLRDLVNDVVDNIHPMMSHNNNRFDVQVPESPGRMFSDETKLRQVLMNLLSNAAKFTENGDVRLGLARRREGEQEWIDFTVEDTGIGIPPEKLDRLFQEFSQIDSSSTRKYGGTGLGLAISRRICEKLGGSVEVDSEPGRGSRFTLCLPADLSRLQPESPVRPELSDSLLPVPEPITAVPADCQALVVDDNAASRDLVRRTLQAEGVEVIEARDGREAIGLLESLRPHLICTDLILPNMNGFDFIKWLRGNPATAALPLVVVSAMDINENDRRELEQHRAAIVPKGVNLRQHLVAMLHGLDLAGKGDADGETAAG
ncbi:signal transduction histidine kinase [Thiohalobacter thiocyanaticus]|uniref:histidine kinase n=1 Tax=Thiohalobacter thiocyanaticus TaxID=585455 RepID=A0A1Z4VQE3_9GAMM|nr:ATP-binding protein [Thiohalobacter thiocyanaticus]BAZ93837.1 signal transduction histidine kinase [Thiohalobacter thiocyanaticus]